MLAPKDVPAFTKNSMKDRLARAEMHYRATGEGGVPEENVAMMVNDLATKFGAPEYAKTDRDQARFLRVRMMADLPNFAGQDVKESSINPVMSPLEGTAVAMALLQQKLYNEEFQVTPE